jgi:predicted permease
VGQASAHLFDLLGVDLHLGRGFLPGEDGTVPGQASQVAVLSHELWQRRFGGDPGLLGSTITLDEIPFGVVGVLPRGFRLQSEIMTVVAGGTDLGLRDVWVPIGQAGSNLRSEGNAFEVLGRLAPGVSIEQARAEADGILAAVPGEVTLTARIEPRREVVTRGFAAPILVMFAGAGLLLLIACANVAMLLVSEAVERRHEFATRSALGAGRWRLSRQLLTESALLGLAGSALGVLVALGGTDLLLGLAPPIPRMEEVAVGGRVLGFAVCAGLSTGFVFGLSPIALLVRRSIAGVLAKRFRDSSEGSSRLQGGAVVVQFALTVVLLAVGGLFARSLMEVRHVDPGFQPDGVATLRVSVPASRYPTQADASGYFEQVVAELEAVPGVESVGGSYGLPFPGGAPRNSIDIGGLGAGNSVGARRRTVLPEYHETLDIPVLEGRPLSRDDEADRPRAMVISESLARQHWQGESPVGSTVGFWGAEWTIVGVVGDVRHTDLFTNGEPTFYVPFAQAPRRNLNLVIRTQGDPAEALPLLRQAVWQVDPDMPLTEVGTLRALLDESLTSVRFRTFLVLALGALASAVAAVGILGLTARTVVRSSRELGIRMALGAERVRLLTGTLRRGLLLAATGMVTGTFAAIGVGRIVSHLLFGVDAFDPLTYGMVLGGLLCVSVVATLLPALKVTRLTPMTVLRDE